MEYWSIGGLNYFILKMGTSVGFFDIISRASPIVENLNSDKRISNLLAACFVPIRFNRFLPIVRRDEKGASASKSRGWK